MTTAPEDQDRSGFYPEQIAQTALEHGEDPLEVVVTQALGATSACWDNLAGAGVFKSEQASEVAERLVGWLRTLQVGRPVGGGVPVLRPGDRLIMFAPDGDAQQAGVLADAFADWLNNTSERIGVVNASAVIAPPEWRPVLAQDGEAGE